MTGEPLAQRLAAIAAKYADDPEDAEALTNEALSRLAYRRKGAGKVCSRCGELRPMSAFGPDGTRPDGLAHRCRDCDNSRKRDSRACKREH